MEKIFNIKDISNEARSTVESILNKKAEGITSITRDNGEWRVLVDVLERRAVPDTQDILSSYELKMTENLELTGYRRVGMRRRADLIVGEEV